jgi:hypothetical protein
MYVDQTILHSRLSLYVTLDIVLARKRKNTGSQYLRTVFWDSILGMTTEN